MYFVYFVVQISASFAFFAANRTNKGVVQLRFLGLHSRAERVLEDRDHIKTALFRELRIVGGDEVASDASCFNEMPCVANDG